MDIHRKSVHMDMDMDVKFHIHGNPEKLRPCKPFVDQILWNFHMMYWWGRSLILSKALSHCLYHFSFRRYLPQIYKVIGPNFFERDDPTFLRQIISAIYCPPFGKVWLSSVFALLTSVCEAWQRGRKQHLRMLGINAGPTLCRLWTKDHEIFRRCRRTLVFSMLLPHCLYRIFRSEYIRH